MTKYCPRCNRGFDDLQLCCPICGGPGFSVNTQIVTDYVSSATSATTISGATYDLPSAIYIDPSFTRVAEKFDSDVTIKVPESELTKDVSNTTLEDYVKEGYLRKIGNNFELTELGKAYYYKNKEFREKVRENREKVKVLPQRRE